MLHSDSFPRLLDLRERGKAVIILGYVPVVNHTVMLCHLERGVAQQFLKGEGVASLCAVVPAFDVV